MSQNFYSNKAAEEKNTQTHADTQRNIETGKVRDIDTETRGHPDRERYGERLPYIDTMGFQIKSLVSYVGYFPYSSWSGD